MGGHLLLNNTLLEILILGFKKQSKTNGFKKQSKTNGFKAFLIQNPMNLIGKRMDSKHFSYYK